MGSCSGKQDIISQNSLIAIETAVEDVKRSGSSEKPSNSRLSLLPTTQLIEERRIKKEKTTEKVVSNTEADKTFETEPSNEAKESQNSVLSETTDQSLNIQVNTLISKQSSDIKSCDNCDCDKTDASSQTNVNCDVGTDPLEYIEYSQPDSFILADTMTGHLDDVYKRVLSSNCLTGDSDGEWLEVINEADELDLENEDNISLVESEIIEECADNGNLENEKCEISDKIGSSQPIPNKEKVRKKSSKPDLNLKRKDSSSSNRYVSNEKKKLDKNKANKNKHEKLWTSRSKEKAGWLEEKIYTTKGKDGMLFKIKIMRKPTKDENTVGNKTADRKKKNSVTEKSNSRSKIQDKGEDHKNIQ
ncbi:uncharacterized protein LOC123538074 [Mercenaria mercenaria]|uniref:uncharacterized protein LOC123538074 n=1 Tax=Mercenaria mercenaria TaxID=6596 RepID=UPI00234EA2C2|nr:uncharacterized protein LOC123538074 [Mercenaria mercenaria]